MRNQHSLSGAKATHNNVPRIAAIQYPKFPVEDFAKPTQPEPGEGNAQRSKAQCRASRKSIISGIRRRIPTNQHRLNGVKSIHHPLQFQKPLPFKRRAFLLSNGFLSALASWRDPISGFVNPSYLNSTFTIQHSKFRRRRRPSPIHVMDKPTILRIIILPFFHSPLPPCHHCHTSSKVSRSRPSPPFY